jgi:hypothetical protein
MALSTTDLAAAGGSGMMKTIAPGNHVLKINSIQLDDYSFIKDAKHLILNLETEPIEGFEGFLIDKDDESKGRFAGQIGRVKASQYAFADGETKSGIKIQRDRSIMIFLKNLCNTLELNEWFAAQDNKHDTIEDFVTAFNVSAPFQDVFVEFCIAGKEYVAKTGYTNYDMYLPKADKGKYAFAQYDEGKVIIYDEATHLKKNEVKEVQAFGDSDDTFSVPKRSSSDFSLD